MQSWQDQGQNGADDHNSWQANFTFSDQDGQYDQAQDWSQAMSDHGFAGQLNPGDASSNFLHDPHSLMSGFQDSHGTFDLASQFPAQDVIDPAFHQGMQSDMFSPQSKLGIGEDSLGHLNAVQNHPHTHGHGFAATDFNSFAQQPNEQQRFGTPAQYSPSQHQLLQHMSRQQSHTPVQQFNNFQANNFAQQLRPSQQSPTQHQEVYGQTPNLAVPTANGHGSQYHAHPSVQQHQSSFNQATFSPADSHNYQSHQPTQASPNSTFSQAISPATESHSKPNSVRGPAQDATAGMVSQPRAEIEKSATPPVPIEPAVPAPKRRARVVKAATESPAPADSPQPQSASTPVPEAASVRKVEDIETFPAPAPSAEDTQFLQAFHKRSKIAQARFPAVKGLPYLASDATVKLPAPKSYDKLVPLVALPPRSGKPLVPELGSDLPCEIQGKFTQKYRPAFDRVGLDERRIEAKTLLDDFDRSMKSLGKKRPKYTEYPHAFKEQLKADEALKNKAGKKAKKELEEERNKPVREAVRPTDIADAAAWDMIGIVYLEPSAAKSSSIIAERVRQAGELFIKLRGDMNVAKQELDQAVKDKKAESDLAHLRSGVEKKKEALYRAVDATIDRADDAILANLGGHQKLITSLVNILITSIKAGDFSGKLPKTVLELFTNFPMTRKIAETTNFDTVRKRFADKGDEEVKEMVNEISAKVKRVLKAAETDSSTGYTGTSRAIKPAAKTATGGTSAKRTRDDDPSTADSRIVKKIAMESTSSSLSKKLAQPKLQLHSASKTTAAKAAASSMQIDKTRPVAKPTAKPTVSAADSPSAGSDDHRPDPKKTTARAEAPKTAPAKPDAKPPAPKMGPAPTSSALSGIASLLDSINAPPSAAPAPTIKEGKEPDANETPEEKAKRLRKEARRSLRVSWKPESELVQIRVFEKVDGEDAGRDVNMIRDAADDRAEGMILKQGRGKVEEDEDDDDIPYQPWVEPTALDFSYLTEEARNKNYVTRGGNVAFKTPEQDFIAQRENRELMAIYSDVADIPQTPKSPPPELSISYEDPRIGNLPLNDAKFEEIGLRWRDEQQMGIDGALYSATQRLSAKSSPGNKIDAILGSLQGGAKAVTASGSASGLGHSARGLDVNVPLVAGGAVAEQVLTLLKSDQVRAWQDHNPIQIDSSRVHVYQDPEVEIAARAVESVVKKLENLEYPARTPPEWLLKDEERVNEWWQGHNKEMAARQKKADQERARAAAAVVAATAGQGQNNAQDWNAYYAQQQQAYAPYMAILQQMNGGQSQPAQAQAQTQAQPQQQPSQQLNESQLQSILAAMGQAQQQAQPAQPAANPTYDADVQQYLRLAQMAGQPQHSQVGENRDHHDWDRDGRQERHGRDRHDDYGRDRDFRGGKDNKKKTKPGPSTIHKPPNAALIGTKSCTFWQQGKCARGDKCTFRHD